MQKKRKWNDYAEMQIALIGPLESSFKKDAEEAFAGVCQALGINKSGKGYDFAVLEHNSAAPSRVNVCGRRFSSRLGRFLRMGEKLSWGPHYIALRYIDYPEQIKKDVVKSVKKAVEAADVIFIFGEKIADLLIGNDDFYGDIFNGRPVFLIESPCDGNLLPWNYIRIGRTGTWCAFSLVHAVNSLLWFGYNTDESRKRVIVFYSDDNYGREVDCEFARIMKTHSSLEITQRIHFDLNETNDDLVNANLENQENIAAIVVVGYGYGYNEIKRQILDRVGTDTAIALITDRVDEKGWIRPSICLNDSMSEAGTYTSFYQTGYDAGKVLHTAWQYNCHGEDIVKRIYDLQCFDSGASKTFTVFPFGDTYSPTVIVGETRGDRLKRLHDKGSQNGVIVEWRRLVQEEHSQDLAMLLGMVGRQAWELKSVIPELLRRQGDSSAFEQVVSRFGDIISRTFDFKSVSFYLDWPRVTNNWVWNNAPEEIKVKYGTLLLLLSAMKERSVLQIGVNRFYSEGNDTFRLFGVMQKNEVLEIEDVFCSTDEVPNKPLLSAIVVAKSRKVARFLAQCDASKKDNVSGWHNFNGVDGFLLRIDDVPKSFVANIAHEFYELRDAIKKHSRAAEVIYLLPANQGGRTANLHGANSAMFALAGAPLSYLDVQALGAAVSRIFMHSHEALHLIDIQSAQVKAAIGSIMSRNGSHNIGSHVLAALSHNVGTMPDDRVLYQYIQHRMDYIATVTTESPSWAASTKFVGEMMRTFLSQRHLLEYIASSEGLHAYRFQDPNIDLKTQTQTIQIHVRYGNSANGNDWLELFSFDGSEKSLDHAKDVSLAIPGGVVGQHAFFTIIENVIRNAAKHGWSSKTEEIRKTENLEIYIDVIDDSRTDSVKFRIWDNMSEVNIEHQLDQLNKVCGSLPGGSAFLSQTQVEALLERYNKESESSFKGEKLIVDDRIPLHWRQQILMDQKIIKEDGSLRRENWGMAEMKISAGYLQRRTVGQIGGLDQIEDPDDYIVRAITVPQDGKHRLGYEFKVPRPKKILIVSKGDCLPGNTSELRRHGVYFLNKTDAQAAIKTWKEGQKTDAFAAEYLVIEDIKGLLGIADFKEIEKDFANHPFPFRILTCESFPNESKLANMIPLVDQCDWFEDGGGNASKIMGGVLSSWRAYCVKRWGDEVAKRGVVESVNTVGESGAGQALISDADIWRLLFTEYFHSTLAPFVINADCRDDLKTFVERLKDKNNRPLYKFFIDENWEIADSERAEVASMWKLADGDDVNADDRSKTLKLQGLDADSIIAWQLKYLLLKVGVADLNDSLSQELDATTGAATEDLYRQLLAVYSRYQREPRNDVARLIKHFKQAFAHLDVMLRKYEERIVTLPKTFSLSKNDGNAPKGGNREKSNDASVSQSKSWILTYDRHHDVNETNCAVGPYVEPLSGSQSYLASLIAYQREKRDTQMSKGPDYEFLRTRLIENGLMRILFVDERVSRFLRNHEKSRYIYRAMNMWCVDEAGLNVDTEGNPKAQKGNLLTFKDAKGDVFGDFLGAIDTWNKDGFKFDILIIHQGILDKWCKIASSVEGMGDIIGKLKAKVDYVVITTGRGTPANIPANARILPFSTIEGTLFKLYPEKLTLVDSVMNILPLGGKRK